MIRVLHFRGRPDLIPGGITADIAAHSGSLRLLGYIGCHLQSHFDRDFEDRFLVSTDEDPAQPIQIMGNVYHRRRVRVL
jgi:hypothetical protein